jgi:hypothetical protein
MNDGKSYEYFADLAGMYPYNDPSERPWDYAMKADDDTLINIPQLLERLRPQSMRKDLYMVSRFASLLIVGSRNGHVAYGCRLHFVVGCSDLAWRESK